MSNGKSTTGKGKKQKTTGSESNGDSSTRVLLQVDLWNSEDEHKDAIPPLAVAMVGDLLSVSHCQVRDATWVPLAATFNDPAQAVRAARHIQHLIHGFSGGVPTGYVRGCITLSGEDEPNPAVDTELMQPSRAQPGPVLIVGSLCEGARSIPGLHFRAISSTVVKAPEPGGVRTVLQLLPADGSEEPPIELRKPAVAQKLPTVAGPPVAPLTALPVRPRPMKEPTVAIIRKPRDKSELAADAAIEDERHDDDRRRPWLWPVVGLAAAAAVAAGLWFGVMRKSPAPTPAKIVDAVAAPAESGTKVPEVKKPVPARVPAPTVPEAADTAVVPPPVKPPIETAAEKRRKAAEAAREKNASATDAQAEDPKSSDKPVDKGNGMTFTSAELNALVAMADRDSGNGQFDKAIREYQAVLKREPGNVQAKEGLARAIRNRDNQ